MGRLPIELRRREVMVPCATSRTNPTIIECKHPNTERRDGELCCTSCGMVLSRNAAVLVTAEMFGRGPDEAVVMDNNLGTSPGPERKRQIMSALNQNPREYNVLRFEQAKVNLLNAWSMSGDPTDRTVSVLLKRTIKTIEAKRGIKIPPSRVDAIARICKLGVKRAERRKRLAKWEIQGIVQRIFEKEGFCI